MSLKKFFAPQAAVLVVLALFWVAGVDSVLQENTDVNLQKYVQTQSRIIDNYVEEIDIDELYKNSIRGMVKNISDSTFSAAGTPLDTLRFNEISVDNLSESFRRFEDAYLYVANNYEDEDMDALTVEAIRGMLGALDPHSVYIQPEASERVQEEFDGQFQGIGVQFAIIQDTITVITPIAGGPSDQLGIMSGDRIINIDGENAVGFDENDVLRTLRGPKGTEVDVVIKRPSMQELLDFTIVRDNIPIYTVDAAYMLDEQTGYIKINRFAATTHSEFMEAMHDLTDQGMNRLVLDLRGNPGGYLGQAISMAEEFFPPGTELVSTQSRHSRFTSSYSSRRDGYFTEQPLIVLVNEGSASASEIVSGAIQDHDRGLIVGQRTFGKGLVQQQYELVDSSNIRVTISKYYTPSGRLIQKPYTPGGSEEYVFEVYERSEDALTDAEEFISHVPDSLIFSTDAGRTVYGGGGIVPDHIIPEDTSQSLAVRDFTLINGIGRNLAVHYLDQNADAFRSEWEDDFERFRSEFNWSSTEKDQLFETLRDSNMVISDEVTVPTIRAGADSLIIPEGHYEEVEWMPLGLMKAELAQQVWGRRAWYIVMNDIFNTTLHQTMPLWEEVSALRELALNQRAPEEEES